MGVMNKKMNLPALQKIMREFEMQNEKMEMTSEMMGDAIDDAFEGEEEEEETSNLVNQVLDEIGITTDQEVLFLSNHSVYYSSVARKCPRRPNNSPEDDSGGLRREPGRRSESKPSQPRRSLSIYDAICEGSSDESKAKLKGSHNLFVYEKIVQISTIH